MAEYHMCIGCAIKNNPDKYTKRQKLKQKRKILSAIGGTNQKEKNELFTQLLKNNKPIKNYNLWDKV